MKEIKIATWNVNSIRTRLQAVTDWLNVHQPQVLCLQETKVQDPDFPKESFKQIGYEVAFTGQKAYNGMAILSHFPLKDVSIEFNGNPDPSQKRFIETTVESIRILNTYIPNGRAVGTPAFDYKLEFIRGLRHYLKTKGRPDMPLVLVGDFNVAVEPRDVYDPDAMEGEILFHPDERAAVETLSQWGLVDTFRLHHEENGHYSWWDYRMNAFKRNIGLRIDYIWATSGFAKQCTACNIDSEPRKQVKPSDHAPVIATFQM